MNTRGLKEIQKALKQQYYEKTGEKVSDDTYITFTNELINDLKRHIYYYYLCEFDEDLYDYFFYSEFLEDLLGIYLKEKGMTMNDIKNILYGALGKIKKIIKNKKYYGKRKCKNNYKRRGNRLWHYR